MGDVTTLVPNLHWDIMSRSAKTKLASRKTSTKKASKSSAALKSSKSKKASKKTSAASRVSKNASKKTSAASRVSKKANQTKSMKTSKTMAKATTINWDPLEVGKTTRKSVRKVKRAVNRMDWDLLKAFQK